METPKKFVAVPGDDGNVKLIPAEDLQVLRMIESKPEPKQSSSSATSIFWILFLLVLLWYLAGGWENFMR